MTDPKYANILQKEYNTYFPTQTRKSLDLVKFWRNLINNRLITINIKNILSISTSQLRLNATPFHKFKFRMIKLH